MAKQVFMPPSGVLRSWSAARRGGIHVADNGIPHRQGMLKVARECGVGSGTVQRVKQEMKGPFADVAA